MGDFIFTVQWAEAKFRAAIFFCIRDLESDHLPLSCLVVPAQISDHSRLRKTLFILIPTWGQNPDSPVYWTNRLENGIQSAVKWQTKWPNPTTGNSAHSLTIVLLSSFFKTLLLSPSSSFCPLAWQCRVDLSPFLFYGFAVTRLLLWLKTKLLYCISC